MNPSDNSWWERLRYALAAEPSPQAWTTLCDLWSEAPEGPDAHVWLDWSRGHLTAWPDALRTAPRSWIERLLVSANLAAVITEHSSRNPNAPPPQALPPSPPALALARRLEWTHALPPHQLHALLTEPHLADLRELILRHAALTDADARTLAHHAPTSLRYLNLGYNHLGCPAIADLLASPRLADLHHLDLSASWLNRDPEPLSAAIAADAPPTLRHLTLRYVSGAWEGVRRLLLGLAPAALHHLDLSSSWIRAGAVLTWANLPALDALHTLDLSDNPLGATIGDAIAAIARRAPLRDLRLARIGLRPADLEALLASPSTAALQRLDLSRNIVGGPALAHLTDAPRGAALQHLTLERAHLTPDDGLALARAEHLTALTHLNLNHNPLGTTAARTIAAAPHLAGLHALHLARTNCGADAVCAIAHHLTQLHTLDLTANRIGRRGFEALTDPTALPHLRRLSLSLYNTPAAWLQALRTHRPDCAVIAQR